MGNFISGAICMAIVLTLGYIFRKKLADLIKGGWKKLTKKG